MDEVRMKTLSNSLNLLPKGNITYKTINGKKYPYYQWTENGKQHGRRVQDEELQELAEKINQRKAIQKELKANGFTVARQNADGKSFFSAVKLGDELRRFVEPVKDYKKRECFRELHEYVYGNSTDRVLILYGLRRTGKTTLIRQLIQEMPEEMFAQTAFVQINAGMDLAKINLDLQLLEKKGCRYVFLDEVTLMDDFIENAALFSDIYASCGMKIVLSGTDSLGFIFTKSQQLYDRCIMLHTTFVPYREFERVLGIKGIDEYIRYGGTMSLSGLNYNQSVTTFATKESTDEYINSAIAGNIQHSLRNYQDGGHFRHLSELYEADELTSAINRIVEDINHRFTLEVLTRDFRSGDLSISAKNLLKNRQHPSDILYRIDREAVTERLREMLEIRNRPEMKIMITDAHRAEIKEYLELLDLMVDLDVVTMTDLRLEKRTVISQPGLRYAQAEALIKSLMDDPVMRTLSLDDRNEARDAILGEIRGRMMEDIVLLETLKANPKCKVFKLVFAVGEFDMVLFDPEAANCRIYEIKHSKERVPAQYQHLMDSKKCEDTSFRYGPIVEKAVIYRGETTNENGIHYINVEEYLCGLKKRLGLRTESEHENN